MPALTHLVSEAVDIVVQCTRTGDRVEVTEVLAVEDPQGVATTGTFTTTPLFERRRSGDPLEWTGNLPVRAARVLEAAGHDVRRLLTPDTAPLLVDDGFRA